MTRFLPLILLGTALAACSSDDIDQTKSNVEAVMDDVKDAGSDALGAAKSTTEDLGDSARETLDRASNAVEDLEDAARRRAEEAAEAAKQARADAEDKVRDNLAKLEEQREKARKAKGEFKREIRAGEEEN